MQIFVYSRRALDAVTPHEVPHVVISITSAPDDLARIRPNPLCLGLLRVSFVDAVDASEHPESALFSGDHANSIWSFLDSHREKIERVIVHCDAGKSRSPAVAAAIAKMWNGDDSEFHGGRYTPNPRVYRMMLEAYEMATKTMPS